MHPFNSTFWDRLVWPRLPLARQAPAILTLLSGVALSAMVFLQAKSSDADRCRMTFERDAEAGVRPIDIGLSSFIDRLHHQAELFEVNSTLRPDAPDEYFRRLASERENAVLGSRWWVRFDANGVIEQVERGVAAGESEVFDRRGGSRLGRLIERAGEAGIAVSEPFRLGLTGGAFGVLMVVPLPKVLEGDIHTGLDGFLGCVVGMKDLVTGMNPGGGDLEYILSDEDAQGSAGYRLDLGRMTEEMGYSDALRGRIGGLRERGTRTFELPVGGRTWSVLVAPTLSYLHGLESDWPVWALASGMAFSLILTDYVLMLMVRFTDFERQNRENAAALASSNRELAHQIARCSSVTEEISKLTQAMECSPVGVAITQPDGLIEYVNKRCLQMTGYSREELVGRLPRLVQESRLAPETVLAIRQQLAQGESWRGEITDRRKDGTHVQFDLSVAPVVSDDGETINLVVVFTDVSQRKQLEGQFLQAQKMEVIGRLAGGVVHDLSNMLTVILGTSQILKSQLAEDDPLVEEIDEIIRVSTQAGAMNRHLLAFARTRSCEAEVVNINEILREMDRFLIRTLGEDVVLKTIADDQDACITIDPGQFSQLVMNLAVNARDAMPNGGELVVKTRLADPPPALRDSFRLSPGDYVMVSVRDTGTGMSEQVRRKVFEPFFTTKSEGKGTGLGMSTVFGIVRQFGGAIDVDSEVGKGTEFNVYFPRSSKSVEKQASHDASEVPHGIETILLVEDDSDVRQLSVALLRGLGYKIVQAEHASEALDFALRGLHSFDLLLTDVVMPEINGVELVTRLRKVRPDLKVILTTGFSEHPLLSDKSLIDNSWMLYKPFTRDSLGRILREALDSHPVAAVAAGG